MSCNHWNNDNPLVQLYQRQYALNTRISVAVAVESHGLRKGHSELRPAGVDIVERQLAGRQYLLDEQFTLADVCYLPFIEFLPSWRNQAAPCSRGLERTAAKPAKCDPE